jgi:hypothetical protein
MKMAKLAKRKLSWKTSRSAQTTGYKLYWARQGELSYDSTCEYLGQVTEVVIPDGLSTFRLGTGPFDFGVVAVDDSGNESDMAVVTAPFHFIAPQAPEEAQLDGIAPEGAAHTKEKNIFELKSRAKSPGKPKAAPQKAPPAAPKPTLAAAESKDDGLEFYETDRADNGAIFTTEDLEIFEADLEL